MFHIYLRSYDQYRGLFFSRPTSIFSAFSRPQVFRQLELCRTGYLVKPSSGRGYLSIAIDIFSVIPLCSRVWVCLKLCFTSMFYKGISKSVVGEVLHMF